MSGRLFVFGLGYSATALARGLMRDGWHVAGTVRDAARAAEFGGQGIACAVYEGGKASPAVAPLLAAASHVLISVPPGAEGDPALRDFGADIRASHNHIEWLGYLSTVGVYGDRGGGTVDEDSALEPATNRGARRVAAEQGWSALARETGIPLAIFRIAGIYGPGRNQLETVLAGTARRIVRTGQVFNRIHVDDIAAAVAASMARPPEGVRAYNLADDEAAPPDEVVAHAARLLGLEPPPEIPFKEAEMSPMAASFYAESKRVLNRRIKEELGIRLKYPTYREGLAALHAAMMAEGRVR